MKNKRLTEYGNLLYEIAEKFVALEQENERLKKEIERLHITITSIATQNNKSC